jgi:hypothetical protein
MCALDYSRYIARVCIVSGKFLLWKSSREIFFFFTGIPECEKASGNLVFRAVVLALSVHPACIRDVRRLSKLHVRIEHTHMQNVQHFRTLLNTRATQIAKNVHVAIRRDRMHIRY